MVYWAVSFWDHDCTKYKQEYYFATTFVRTCSNQKPPLRKSFPEQGLLAAGVFGWAGWPCSRTLFLRMVAFSVSECPVFQDFCISDSQTLGLLNSWVMDSWNARLLDFLIYGLLEFWIYEFLWIHCTSAATSKARSLRQLENECSVTGLFGSSVFGLELLVLSFWFGALGPTFWFWVVGVFSFWFGLFGWGFWLIISRPQGASQYI